MTWQPVLLIASSVAAATLIQAGLGKLVTAARLRQALTEVGVPARLTPDLTIRGYAGLEVVAGLALLAGPTRVYGAVLVGVLGAAFAGLGVLGMVRGSVQPCGCFGNPAGAPLGLTNVALGAALAAVGVANLVMPAAGSAAGSELPGAGMVLGTSVAMLALCAFTHRAWALPLLRPQRRASS